MIQQGLTRQHLITLTVAQLMTFALLLPYLSPLLLGALTLACVVRLSRGASQWQRPSLWLRTGLLCAGIAAITFSSAGFRSVEGFCSFLVLAFGLKSLELLSRRDAWVVMLSGLFATACGFLFSQNFLQALGATLCLAAWLSAMVMLSLPRDTHLSVAIRHASQSMVLALPLMALCYLFFPRLDPLWSMPLTRSATTGISEQMSPGSIASLAQSDALAFRVSFSDLTQWPEPVQAHYWRVLVLSRFDGSTWTPDRSLGAEQHTPVAVSSQQALRHYDILASATQQRWLPSLNHSLLIQGNANHRLDDTWQSPEPLRDARRYHFAQGDWADATAQSGLTEAEERAYLQLPANTNPRLRQWAGAMRLFSPSPAAFVSQIMRIYRQRPFFYTLHPPQYDGPDGMDRFFFDEQSGFCGHYAASLVIILRNAEIPARLVTGYAGGRWNAEGNFLAIRERDAHAWVEAWLPEQGWVRLDPTAMIPAERIAADVPRDEIDSEGRLTTADDAHWWSGIRQRWEAWEFLWQQKVVGYDEHSGLLQLREWIVGTLHSLTQARQQWQQLSTVYKGLLALVLLAALLGLWWGKKRLPQRLELAGLSPEARALRELSQLTRLPLTGMSPRQAMALISQQHPHTEEAARALTTLLEQRLYHPAQGPSARQLRQGYHRLRRSLRQSKSLR